MGDTMHVGIGDVCPTCQRGASAYYERAAVESYKSKLRATIAERAQDSKKERDRWTSLGQSELARSCSGELQALQSFLTLIDEIKP